MAYVRALGDLAKAIEQESGGRIRVETRTKGAGGSEADALKDQIRGRLEGGYTSATTLSRSLLAFRLLTIPMLFSQPEHVLRFIGSNLEATLRATAERKGLQVLGYGSYGFYGILGFGGSRTLPGKVVRLPRDPWLVKIHKQLLLKPVHVPAADLPRALDSGWLDGIVATPELLQRTLFLPRATFFLETRHLHGWMVFTVNQAWFHRLPKGLRRVVANTVQRVTQGALQAAFLREGDILAAWSRSEQPQRVLPLPRLMVDRLRGLVNQAARRVEKILRQRGAVSRLWYRNRPSADAKPPQQSQGRRDSAVPSRRARGSGSE